MSGYFNFIILMSLPGARIVVKAGEKRRRRRWRGKGDRDIVHGKVVGHCCLAGCCCICPRSASLCLTSDKTQPQCGWEGWGLGFTYLQEACWPFASIADMGSRRETQPKMVVHMSYILSQLWYLQRLTATRAAPFWQKENNTFHQSSS